MELSKKAMSIKPSTTMAISSRAAEMKAAGVDVVSFGAGEPDFDTPAHIAQAGIDAIQNGQTRYTPAAGTPELRQAVCDKLKRDNGLEYEPAQVVISNGAKHSLMNTFMAILHEGDEVIIPAPFWLSYAEMVRIAGGVPVIIHTKKENGFMMTKEELENAYSAKTKAVVLTTPSNPTGQVMSRADLEMVAEFAVSHDILVVSDEIYEKLIYEDDKQHISIASLGQDIYDRTIVINGVSKSYAMTGWRIGYAWNLKSAEITFMKERKPSPAFPHSSPKVPSICLWMFPDCTARHTRGRKSNRQRILHPFCWKRNMWLLCPVPISACRIISAFPMQRAWS